MQGLVRLMLGPVIRAIFRGGSAVAALAILVGLPAATQPAQAQAWWDSYQHGPREIDQGFLPTPSIATSLPNNGDPWGYRKWLGERGIVYGLEYTNDVLSNLRGGLRTGTIDQGKLHGILTVDLGKLAGLDGLSFFATRFRFTTPGGSAGTTSAGSTPSPPSRRCRRHGCPNCGWSKALPAARPA